MASKFLNVVTVRSHVIAIGVGDVPDLSLDATTVALQVKDVHGCVLQLKDHFPSRELFALPHNVATARSVPRPPTTRQTRATPKKTTMGRKAEYSPLWIEKNSNPPDRPPNSTPTINSILRLDAL
jgi:hypothetical protein